MFYVPSDNLSLTDLLQYPAAFMLGVITLYAPQEQGCHKMRCISIL